MALGSGLRKAELLELTWDRVDMSPGVIRLELTKSGKRREVPMRQAKLGRLPLHVAAADGRSRLTDHARNHT